MIDDSPKRFDRIVAILIQLQSKKIVKAQDLADRFQVSLRTIYRDIRTLEASGVPILSEAGSGYSIMEGYRLPPVMFTREEASSFVAAEKLMQQLADRNLGSSFRSAMYKVKSVLRSKEKDWISMLETQIAVHPAQSMFNENVPDALELIMSSIAEQKQLSLYYHAFGAEEPTERMIEPVGLFHENNFWYVLGYCHLRGDYRQFRADRIQGIRRSDLPFTRKHGPMEQYRCTAPEEDTTLVRIRIDKQVARYLRSGRKYYGFLSEEPCGNQVEMRFRVPESSDAFPRWYLMFGDRAEILEPESMKERVRALAAQTLANLGVAEGITV